MKKGNVKKSFTSQKFRSGMYSSILTVIVVAAVILLNLVFSKLNLSTDLSQNSLFTLSEDTKSVLKKLDQDVTFYYMVQEGNEQSYINEILKRYASSSDHIKLVKRDPVVYQSFVAEYSQTGVSDNDVLVVNDKTDSAIHVQATSMYYQDYSNYYSGYSSGSAEQILDVEGQMTAAIQNVTANNKVKIYALSGHDEVEIGSTLAQTLTKRNIAVEYLTLTESSGIPEDCDILLVNGPGTDLLPDEIQVIKDYLDNGGKAIMAADDMNINVENYTEFVHELGIDLVEGQVLDPDQCNYYVNWVVPTPDQTSEITSELGKSSTLFVYPQGLQVSEDADEDLIISSLFTTSDSSFSRVDSSIETAEKQDSDLDGPFSLGYSIEKETDGGTMQIALFSSHYLFVDDTVSIAPGNEDLFLNAVNWMTEVEVAEVSIPSKTLSYSTITVQPGNVFFWAALMIIIIPGALLVWGFVIWWLRRKC